MSEDAILSITIILVFIGAFNAGQICAMHGWWWPSEVVKLWHRITRPSGPGVE